MLVGKSRTKDGPVMLAGSLWSWKRARHSSQSRKGKRQKTEEEKLLNFMLFFLTLWFYEFSKILWKLCIKLKDAVNTKSGGKNVSSLQKPLSASGLSPFPTVSSNFWIGVSAGSKTGITGRTKTLF